jgi:hypothetical protein
MELVTLSDTVMLSVPIRLSPPLPSQGQTLAAPRPHHTAPGQLSSLHQKVAQNENASPSATRFRSMSQ